MQTHISHIQFNVKPENVSFYKDLLAFLGWQALYEGEGILGMAAAPDSTSLWFASYTNGASNDYDGPGMNHFAIGTVAQADVDAAAAYLGERGVALLFETPRHRPEFAQSPEHTYYQVMFETPDRILFEVVYMGLKSA